MLNEMTNIEKFLKDFPVYDNNENPYDIVITELRNNVMQVNLFQELLIEMIKIGDNVHIHFVHGFQDWQNGLKVKLSYSPATMCLLWYLGSLAYTYNEERNGAWLLRKFLRWHDEPDFRTNSDLYLIMALSDCGLCCIYDEVDDFSYLFEEFWYDFGLTDDDLPKKGGDE